MNTINCSHGHAYDADEFNSCPICSSTDDYLQPGTKLLERYIIKETIGRSSSRIIYSAVDTLDGNKVTVSELYLNQQVAREKETSQVVDLRKSQGVFQNAKKRFLAEGQAVQQFRGHSNHVETYAFFEENNTAYIVSELLEGMTLKQYLEKNKGAKDIGFAMNVAEQIGSALIAMHKRNMTHCNVCPENIFLCNDNDRIVLLDFSSARLGNATDAFIYNSQKRSAYFSTEQYDNRGISSASDIYGLGATVYRIVTGVEPHTAIERRTIETETLITPSYLNFDITKKQSSAILRAMSLDPNARFKTVRDFILALQGKGSAAPSKRLPIWIAAIAAAAAVIVLCLFIGKNAGKLKDADISVWIPLREGSDQSTAVQAVLDEFKETNPNVTVRLTTIPEKNYAETIAEAAKTNNLPTLFESTGISNEIIQSAADLNNVLKSKQAKNCLFLDQYNTYYANAKKLPLGIVVPAVQYIKDGSSGVNYESTYFYRPEDFHTTAPIAANPDYLDLITLNFGGAQYGTKKEFGEQKSLVYLTSTMDFYDPELSDALKDRQTAYAFPNNDAVACDFTYEWSIGKGSQADIAAAEKLLSNMLGEQFQNYLMISKADDGQLPINEASFYAKLDQYSELKPLAAIYDRFVFPEKYNINYVLNGGAFSTASNLTVADENQREVLTNPIVISLNTASDGTFRVEDPKRDSYHFIGWEITGMDETQHAYVLNDSMQTQTISGTTLSIGASNGAAEANEYQNLRQTPGTVTFTAIWAPTIVLRYCTLQPEQVKPGKDIGLYLWEQNTRAYIIYSANKKYAERKLIAETTDPEELRALLQTPVDAENGLHNYASFGLTRPGFVIVEQTNAPSWNKDAKNPVSGYVWTATQDWDGNGKVVRDFNENDNALQWQSVLPKEKIDQFISGTSVAVNVYAKWTPAPEE